MNTVLSTIVLLAATAGGALCQNPRKSERRHYEVECRAFDQAAYTYFQKHGLVSLTSHGFDGFTVQLSQREPWTNDRGDRITDFSVYWTYADRSSSRKLPIGVWHLRLGHYTLRGALKQVSEDAGCSVEFDISFQASGANVLGILPVDSVWEYFSNGRLEREYLDGISASLSQ